MENNKAFTLGGIARPTLLLTAICTTVTLLLALTNLLTVGRIARNAEVKAAESRHKVLEAADYIPANADGTVYKAFDAEDRLIGVVVTTKAGGYGGTIEVMTGIRADGGVSGVNILSMEETPGLGAKAKEDSFLRQFKGLTDSGAAVNKDGGDIDALSGATITSRAVTKAVNEAVEISRSYLTLPEGQDHKITAGGKE